jgi:hypothetical protein
MLAIAITRHGHHQHYGPNTHTQYQKQFSALLNVLFRVAWSQNMSPHVIHSHGFFIFLLIDCFYKYTSWLIFSNQWFNIQIKIIFYVIRYFFSSQHVTNFHRTLYTLPIMCQPLFLIIDANISRDKLMWLKFRNTLNHQVNKIYSNKS